MKISTRNASGRESAPDVFESFNSKGVPLVTADLVRNYLLIAENHREQKRLFEKYWEPITGVFGDDPGSIKLNNAITEGWLAEEFGPSSLDKDAQLARYYLKVAEETGVHFFNAAEFIEADPADGVHMNDAGHAVMAEKIYEQVKNIIG